MCCRVTLGFGDGIGLTVCFSTRINNTRIDYFVHAQFIVLANLLSLLSIVGLAYWIGVCLPCQSRYCLSILTVLP